MLLAYKEMGWLAPAAHDHHLEQSWIVWDRSLLRDWRLRQIIESAGPLFPSILEACYVLVYALPVFYDDHAVCLSANRARRQLLVIYLLGLFLSYVQFPFWPSEPPRIVFPGEDAPTVDTLLRQFNHWILGGYGIHTSVFPSAHVSGAVAAGVCDEEGIRGPPLAVSRRLRLCGAGGDRHCLRPLSLRGRRRGGRRGGIARPHGSARGFWGR